MLVMGRERDGNRDARGQAEVLGVVLLLGLTVVSVGLIVATGSDAVDGTREAVRDTAAENALYKLDSQAMLVAYGNADRRRVELGRADAGRYEVRPGAGWLTVEHRNYSGTQDETIVNRSLGTVAYAREDSEIACQGGGVFRRDGEGSVVLSPPRLDYHRQTFTVPAIRVKSAGGGTERSSGAVAAVVTAAGPSTVVYPNATRSYGGGSKSYTNPVSGGKVVITVRSRFYTGWAEYFRSIGEVTVWDSNRTVRMVLPVKGTTGEFALGDGASLRGIDEGHAVGQLNLTFRGGTSDWSSFATAAVFEGFRGEYRVSFESTSPHGPCKDGGQTPEMKVVATYDPVVGADHVWRNGSAIRNHTGAFTYECDDDEFVVHANLTGETNLTYADGPDSVTFDEHPADGNRTYAEDADEASVDLLTNHYVARIGDNPTMTVTDPRGQSMDIDASRGVLEYQGGTVITYLRVTNGTVRVGLN